MQVSPHYFVSSSCQKNIAEKLQPNHFGLGFSSMHLSHPYKQTTDVGGLFAFISVWFSDRVVSLKGRNE